MDGNPYSKILDLIRAESSEETFNGETSVAGIGAGPAKMRLGQVIQKVPLKIKVAGIEQPTEVLRINERLVKGATWKAKTTSSNSDYKALTGALNGSVTCGGSLSDITAGQLHSADTTIDEATVEQLEIDLELGDEVLLLTTDDQIFFIIMKVVKAV